MKRAFLVVFGLVLLGCPNKDKAGEASPAASAASAAPVAVATAAPTQSAAPVAAAAQDPKAATGGIDVPGVTTDPNSAPSHDDHAKTAAAQIQKKNYKSEMDKLEKEDLAADKK